MPLEIERKFLLAALPSDWPVPFVDSHLVQAYLVPRDKRTTSERVRTRIPTDGGPCVYTHTKKVRVSDGVHEEDEREVSKASYNRLLKRADPAMVPISKVRRVFDWAGQTFELDVFSGPHTGLIVMEVELPSEDTPVTLPPWLNITREVTTERDFTNAAMARKGRWP